MFDAVVSELSERYGLGDRARLRAIRSLHHHEVARLHGVRDLRRSALDKVKAGVTSLAEINRVTKD